MQFYGIKKLKRKIKNFIKSILLPINPVLDTKLAYRSAFKSKINLKDPKNLNEKVLYLKLNDYYNNELVTKCSDKYCIREYLENKGMNDLVPKLYGVYSSVKDIEWDKLPNSFVVKCNHGCGYNIIVKDKNKENIENDKKLLQKWLKEDYWKKGEIQYKYIKKKIIIEEYLGDVKTYKFYCFNGEPKIMYISSNKWENGICEKDKYIDFFDMNFNHINCLLKGHPNNPDIVNKPNNFSEMVKISRRLSEDFPFVRVDLYDVNEKVYISELTFCPTNGFMQIEPENLINEWGIWLKLK